MDADRPRQVGVTTTPADVTKGPLLMRIKMFLLAIVAVLAMNVSAQAGAVLGFAAGQGQGMTDSGPAQAGDPGSGPVIGMPPDTVDSGNTPQSNAGNAASSVALDPIASI